MPSVKCSFVISPSKCIVLCVGNTPKTTVGTNANTPNTVYPKGFSKVDVDWQNGQPLVTLPPEQRTGYSETDTYILEHGIRNAVTGKDNGFGLWSGINGILSHISNY